MSPVMGSRKIITVVVTLFLVLCTAATVFGGPSAGASNATTTSSSASVTAASANETFTPELSASQTNAPTTHEDPVLAKAEAEVAQWNAVQKYLSSPERINMLKAVTHQFGLAVRTDMKYGTWGIFDSYCFHAHTLGGYVSQGYKPLKHDHCWIQHNPGPGYGAPFNTEVAAEVIYGPFWYSHSFLGVNVATSVCTAGIEFDTYGAPSTTIAVNKTTFESTDNLNNITPEKARQIDRKAVTCIKRIEQTLAS